MSNIPIKSDTRTWKCALYLRLSKEDGDKAESDSISNQRELITNYLMSFSDLRIVTEHIDDGFSGVDFNRPSFTMMLYEIKASASSGASR
ncbi:MAG: recombinase family protein [Chitinispirillales bacterium]|jgi:DNA invertase Pin-like site-specific DNA recombinase|nr:recombinase family protein [Chitinispirillales bacterium]